MNESSPVEMNPTAYRAVCYMWECPACENKNILEVAAEGNLVECECCNLSFKLDGVLDKMGESAPHWKFGDAESNGRPVPTCSKCGWAVNGDLGQHEKKCWK